jgi:FKBP12-rapamycin complex-associated protein
MIGYVIGLGDRHPGNILVEQTKFNAISIDFGDVFEAAAERAAFPEHVPFRLTPEIYHAFEVSTSACLRGTNASCSPAAKCVSQFAAVNGVEAPGSRGHFKMSSIITMGVLREHKDTLLAMLEAFALDPLLTWQAKVVENPAGKPKHTYSLD